MDTHKKIAKNALWLFGGQITGRIIRAAIIIYAARILGAASWGAFSYALSIAAFLTIFADIGINGLLVREGSKNPHLRDKYLATSLFIKLGLIAVLSGLTLAFTPALSVLSGAQELLPIVLLIFMFDSLRDFVLALARALERMEIEGIVTIFTNVAIAGFGFAALMIQETSVALAYAYVAGTALGLIAAILPLRTHFKDLVSNLTPSLVTTILSSAWTFGLIGVMGAIMINTDVIMLGWMVSEEQVGLYSSAQKLVQLIYVAPALLATAFFPQIAKRAAESKERFTPLFEQALRFVYLLAFPLTIGGILAAKPIITLLYGGDYSLAWRTFAILSGTFVIVFPATLISNAMFAFNEQRKLLTYVVIGVVGNIVFNILFIPIWGIEGSALSTLLNQTIMNIYMWYKLKQIVSFSIFRHLGKIALSSTLMGIIVLFLLGQGLPVLVVISIGTLVYISFLLLLKEETAQKAYRAILSR